MELFRERRRLAALTIQKEQLIQQLAVESLQKTAEMLGSSDIITMTPLTRSDQPEPPAVAIVRQNGLSSASSRASVARSLIHPCHGRSGEPRW